jgi:hypothetical protein
MMDGITFCTTNNDYELPAHIRLVVDMVRSLSTHVFVLLLEEISRGSCTRFLRFNQSH